MVNVTLEGLWMVADGIVDFRFFVKFDRSGPAKIFSFWTLREHVSYSSKKLLNKQKTSSTWWVFLWKDYRCFLIELSIFDFSSNFICPIFCQIWQVQTCNNFQFLISHRTCLLCVKKAPNQAKDLINMVYVTLEGLCMVSDKIVDFRFFVKFDRSRHAIIFNFWTLREHVSYASKKLLNKQKTSSTRWVFLWKDYRCFLIEVSIFWFFV